MIKNRFDVPLKIKSVGDSGEFSGYGSVFGVKDSYDDVVIKGAFEKSLAQWKEKGMLPSLLWQHKMDEPIGIYTKMEEDDHGLYVEGRLLIDDDPLARRAHAHMKAGSLTGMSIGYTLPDGGWTYDKDKGIFALSEIELWELSLVTIPSNDQSRIEQVKNRFGVGETPNPSLVERHLRDVGFSRRQAKAFMSDGYKALDLRDAEKENLEALQNLIKSIN